MFYPLGSNIFAVTVILFIGAGGKYYQIYRWQILPNIQVENVTKYTGGKYYQIYRWQILTNILVENVNQRSNTSTFSEEDFYLILTRAIQS